MWKIVLKVAVAIGLDKWAKKKAKALIDKYRMKAAKKAIAIEDVVNRVKTVLAEGPNGERFVVDTLTDGTVKVRKASAVSKAQTHG